MLPANLTAPRVTVIDPRTPEKAKLRVAAYCRVSSDSADQLNSYLAQVDFYTKHIAENPDWELVDIYADEGISGLEAKKRDEFNRMISDCRAGKIDRVLVKSISRFARNTQDYLQYMRELLRLGVTIHFEKENLDTGKLSTEQVAAIYGAFAQMESTNHSNNMRFSVKMRMEKGIFTPSSMPFGYRLNGLEPEIVPEEAEIVRHIFGLALSGQGQRDIARELNKLGMERGRGRTVWRPNTVRYILTNSFYTGDSDWHKTCATDTVPFCQVRNRGQKPKYHVEDDHPGIVSRDDFQRVQAVIARRRGQFYDGTPARSIFSKRLYCGQCGAVLRRKVNSGKVYWVCHRHDDDKRQCPSAPIPETKLTAACLRLWNKLTLYGRDVLSPLLDQFRELRERELRSNRRLADIDKEIAHISEQNLVLTRLQSNGYVDSALYLSQLDELDRKLRDLRRLRRKILESAGEDGQIQATEAILAGLEEHPGWHDEITAEFFETLVERIIVSTDGQLKFRLHNGLELTERME